MFKWSLLIGSMVVSCRIFVVLFSPSLCILVFNLVCFLMVILVSRILIVLLISFLFDFFMSERTLIGWFIIHTDGSVRIHIIFVVRHVICLSSIKVTKSLIIDTIPCHNNSLIHKVSVWRWYSIDWNWNDWILVVDMLPIADRGLSL